MCKTDEILTKSSISVRRQFKIGLYSVSVIEDKYKKKYHRGAGELSNSNKLRDPVGYSMAAKVWNMSRNSDNFFALAPDSIEIYFANTFSNWNIIFNQCKIDNDKKRLDMDESNLCYKALVILLQCWVQCVQESWI